MQVVRSIFDGLGVDDEWCVWTERGFRWWPHRNSQRVWVDPPELHPSGDTTWLLHAEADCAAVSHDPAESMKRLEAQLSDFGRRLSMTAIYRDDDRVVLHATAVLHEGNVDWVRRVFQVVVLSQARVALKAGTILSAVYGLAMADSEHPTNGRRTEPDEVLSALDHPPPVSQDWSYAEFGRAADYLTGAGVFSMGGVAGLTAEFPVTPGDAPLAFGGATNLLTAEAEETERGWQLRLTLRLPAWPTDADGVQYLPVDLNLMEAAGESGTHLIGSWAANGDDPTAPPCFASIFPPVLFEPGLLTNLALAMGVRSKWVSQYIEATVGFGEGVMPDLNDEAFRQGFLEFLNEYLVSSDTGEFAKVGDESETDLDYGRPHEDRQGKEVLDEDCELGPLHELTRQLADRIRTLGPSEVRSVEVMVSAKDVQVVAVRDAAGNAVKVPWGTRQLIPEINELASEVGSSFMVDLRPDGTFSLNDSRSG